MIEIEIPIKVVRHGDNVVASKYVHHGKRLMVILERLMDFQGLRQCKMRKEIEPGVIVEASKIFGLRKIDIYVGGEKERKYKEVVECPCNDDFALGFIVELCEDLLDDEFQLYNVAVCSMKYHYVLRENILPSDFTKYKEFQQVILIPYNFAIFQSYAVNSGFGIVATGCLPVRPLNALSDEEWRTIMRIIPWCAVDLPKWIKRREVR
jgi:hypothetical protein